MHVINPVLTPRSIHRIPVVIDFECGCCGYLCGTMAGALAILLLQGCCSYVAVLSDSGRLKEVFGWKQLDFQFPDQNTKGMAIESGAYVQANNMPVGLDVWKDKLFITVPRWKTGVWSTLNYVSLENGNGTILRQSCVLVPKLERLLVGSLDFFFQHYTPLGFPTDHIRLLHRLLYTLLWFQVDFGKYYIRTNISYPILTEISTVAYDLFLTADSTYG